MSPIAIVAACIAAAIHVFFWVLESLRFSRPETWRRFNVESQRDADLLRPMAFNQGFYNLFLAVGAVAGVAAVVLDHAEIGRTLVLFTCGSMALAGLVLVVTDRRLIGSAFIQSTAPVVAVVAALALCRSRRAPPDDRPSLQPKPRLLPARGRRGHPGRVVWPLVGRDDAGTVVPEGVA